MVESERDDDEVKHEAVVTLACMSQTLLEPHNIPNVLNMIKEVSQFGNESEYALCRCANFNPSKHLEIKAHSDKDGSIYIK